MSFLVRASRQAQGELRNAAVLLNEVRQNFLKITQTIKIGGKL